MEVEDSFIGLLACLLKVIPGNGACSWRHEHFLVFVQEGRQIFPGVLHQNGVHGNGCSSLHVGLKGSLGLRVVVVIEEDQVQEVGPERCPVFCCVAVVDQICGQ